MNKSLAFLVALLLVLPIFAVVIHLVKRRKNMFCPSCGKEVEENKQFCSNCGTKIEPNIQGITYETISLILLIVFIVILGIIFIINLNQKIQGFGLL